MAMCVAGVALADVTPDTPIWFTQPIFDDDTYEENTVVSGDVCNGQNTVQKVVLDNSTYYMVIHPEYFGGSNHDDSYNAHAVLTINSLFVYNPSTSGFEPCYDGEIATVPAAYTQDPASDYPYLQFIVVLKHTDLDTGTETSVSWLPAYLDLSEFDY
jgi:hypothetical protein